MPEPRLDNAKSVSPMELALAEAHAAALRGEVPVGAVVTGPDGTVLACAGNRVEAAHDAAGHAELLALRAAASSLGQTRLQGCDLWVTLEPCPMCAAAAGLFRVRKILFGAYDPKGGGIEHGPRVFQAAGCLHVPEIVGGLQEAACAAPLKAFFAARR